MATNVEIMADGSVLAGLVAKMGLMAKVGHVQLQSAHATALVINADACRLYHEKPKPAITAEQYSQVLFATAGLVTAVEKQNAGVVTGLKELRPNYTDGAHIAAAYGLTAEQLRDVSDAAPRYDDAAMTHLLQRIAATLASTGDPAGRLASVANGSSDRLLLIEANTRELLEWTKGRLAATGAPISAIRVEFSDGSSELDNAALSELKGQIERFHGQRVRFAVQGYADRSGDHHQNENLSWRRAIFVAQTIARMVGIPWWQIDFKGQGDFANQRMVLISITG